MMMLEFVMVKTIFVVFADERRRPAIQLKPGMRDAHQVQQHQISDTQNRQYEEHANFGERTRQPPQEL